MATLALKTHQNTQEAFKMTSMESLNSFFIEWLMSVAGEIFEAVKDPFWIPGGDKEDQTREPLSEAETDWIKH